jgi:hypothetical protein
VTDEHYSGEKGDFNKDHSKYKEPDDCKSSVLASICDDRLLDIPVDSYSKRPHNFSQVDKSKLRIIQKNLVYVIGLTPNIAKEEVFEDILSKVDKSVG